MTLSLYATTVPTFLQMLGSTQGLLLKAEEWRDSKGLNDTEMLTWNLAPDMFPLGLQINQMIAHSAGALAAVQAGVFIPNAAKPEPTLGLARARIGRAIEELKAIKPEAIDDLVGRDMRFEYGEMKLPFTAEDFLFTFSQPNFFFHVSTAYGILRLNGLPVGKNDFMGAIRIKAAA